MLELIVNNYINVRFFSWVWEVVFNLGIVPEWSQQVNRSI
jgi:hypothetical protein